MRCKLVFERSNKMSQECGNNNKRGRSRMVTYRDEVPWGSRDYPVLLGFWHQKSCRLEKQ
jgi:hypothetical protein